MCGPMVLGIRAAIRRTGRASGVTSRAAFGGAAATAPDTAAWWAGIGYCLAKLDRGEVAITAYRRAVELEPANAVWRNDLGWSLAEIGQLEAARELLEQALALSGDDYDLARGNLDEVEERLSRSSDTASPAL